MRYRPFAISLLHDGNHYTGKVTPLNHHTTQKQYPTEFSVVLNGIFRGIFTHLPTGWESTSLEDAGLVTAIGNYIVDWYQLP